ncbi:stage III sporulation protein AF [Tissierella pigra]|uniref:Stage III sporulation protein AF n=1 Tax=Tissierella pigra TaxID=2607614 RepID=A0A6N7XTM6_9FIRM|nr:stage III sporulation protein AF [Tissierella pigra]MBU5426666.1 stage III sporulation protein AF [Tissierella pigra]MST99893.1 stage III sporulation protein AF [Tissierella pigra]
MNIITFLSSWLKDIVILFILISIAELAMPNGNMKKYINMVIGLLIIFTIVSPFAKLIKMDFNLDKAVFNYSRSSNSNGEPKNNFYAEQEKQIEKVYKEKICREVTALIEDNTDHKVLDIKVDILNTEEHYGEIDNLNIILGNKENSSKDKISIDNIVPVEINKNQNHKKTSEDDFESLKELIGNSYSVNKDKINIKNNEKRKDE